MAVAVRVEPLDRDISLILSNDLSPAARSSTIAAAARTALAEGESQNKLVLGRIVPHKTFVDGVQGTSENNVRPDGVIVYEFELISDVFVWIADQLRIHAPVLTGAFRESFTLFADGTEIKPGEVVPVASEYVFLSPLPYARKIERGQSSQAPDGVFEVVAAIAQQRLGNVARIRFSYRAPISGELAKGRAGNTSDNRTPAIVVTTR